MSNLYECQSKGYVPNMDECWSLTIPAPVLTVSGSEGMNLSHMKRHPFVVTFEAKINNKNEIPKKFIAILLLDRMRDA